MQVPGHAGYSIIGDESIEFIKTPRDYLEKRRKSHGDVFLGRLLNRPTVFLTSNKAVQELLKEKWTNFSFGYNEYGMMQLFDENLVFLEGDAWCEMKRSLEQVFHRDSVAQSMEQCHHIIKEHFKQMTTGEPIVVYEMFKALATQLSIALFLSHDIGNRDAQEVSELMSAHWRGMISVPVSIRAPWAWWKSGYSKAITAKERLMEIISEHLKSNPSNIASGIQESCTDQDTAVRQLLLFTSALIPKALASLLTSTVLALSDPENARWRQCHTQDGALEDVSLEVQRLWPPFFGGRRICTQSCEVRGYKIPKDHSVVYSALHANKDPSVFPEPDSFKPDRWTNENANDRDKVWTFGGGPRHCIGKLLSTTLLKECTEELLKHYQWEVVSDQDLIYKTLPIVRPKYDIQAIFTRIPPTLPA